MHEEILKLKEQGLRNIDIAKQLNIQKSTVTYHLNQKYHGRDYYLIRNRNIKQQAVLFKGGKCCICGYSKCNAVLQFHHLDPKLKAPEFKDKAVTRQGKNFETIKPELDKCVLLCANCHGEVHAGISSIPPLIS